MFDLIPDYVKQAPVYHLLVEAFLLVWIIWLIFFRKSYSPNEKSKLTEKVNLIILLVINIIILKIIKINGIF